DQVACICDALFQEGDIKRLSQFLLSIPQEDLQNKSESLLKARAMVAFHRGCYQEVYNILENNKFDTSSHEFLQCLWYKAHYSEGEKLRGRSLSAVDKFRIRKKSPLPNTISDGEKTIYFFKEKVRTVLKECYEHKKYPTLKEKRVIATQTNLTLRQVRNWFRNRR
ncbi:predicted protein, partial [Nematostella vectensis]